MIPMVPSPVGRARASGTSSEAGGPSPPTDAQLVEFRKVRDVWEEYARQAPLERILERSPSDGVWSEEEFFRTGRTEISEVWAYVNALGISLGRDCALDFGCGVGRLTLALAGEFHEVWGVDISPTMVKMAQQRISLDERIHCCRLETPDLSLFSTGKFDFVYSNLALQHVGGLLLERFLSEIVRVLKPGGIAIFQLPSPTLMFAFVPPILLRAGKKVLAGRDRPDSYGLIPRTVDSILARAGARVVASPWYIGRDAWGAPQLSETPLPVLRGYPVMLRRSVSFRYCAVRRSG